MEPRQCPLCGGGAEYFCRDPMMDALNVECERCGRFSITEQALMALKPEHKPGLSAFCRRARHGHNVVKILSTTIEPMLSSLPKYSAPEKLDNLLQLMADLTPQIGVASNFDPDRDYPLLVASGEWEIDFLQTELQKRGYLAMLSDKSGSKMTLGVTIRGWERLEEIRRTGRNSTQAFVAMWFNPSMDEVYASAIEPAIRDAGYKPLRIDQSQHVNRIDDEIIGQIKRSRFMVADFTGQRHGVYFEAGMMLGIGRTVVWMCKEEELAKKEDGLHFDGRQFNFIAYSSLEDARKRLYDRILAIEGEGPGANATRQPQ